MQVKLKDIAKELNLSVSTISRVVNGKDRVDSKTRKKVLKALENYDFKPNEIARSLRLRSTKTNVVIVPDIVNNFYASLIKGAQQVCHESGYSLMVCNTDEDKNIEKNVISNLLNQQIAGIILASVDGSETLVEYLQRYRMKVVYVDNMPHTKLQYDSVTINNLETAYTLTKKMIERGYSNIGFITGTLEQSSGSERLEGYKKALQEANLIYDNKKIAIGDFKKASGYNGMKELLKNNDKFDAIVVSNNFMAYGAVKAIRESNLSIPEDIAIAAFDVVDQTGLITPKITSINQPATKIGKRAAEILLNKLTKDNDKMHSNIILNTIFSPGESW